MEAHEPPPPMLMSNLECRKIRTQTPSKKALDVCRSAGSMRMGGTPGCRTAPGTGAAMDLLDSPA